ncbi:MAG: beta-ketoacyl-ACP synthase II [Candidatus Palauibacterales bacterium]|nr:beta-ketoacyl-ACP synthase II [Candidatus Palauibacterales bacterium]MDP2529362.1 beta-ketoacyl-ACP synthase II [Candidatus Palauibacterales bacterium]MDP2583231.1 beta-ketoacyl-ACP synthase II [Candidatus Palauibacterales bacterium]
MTGRRVVITGTGLITAVGNDVRSTWESLLAGRSGAAPITLFDASRHDVRFACEVKDFDPSEYLDRKEVKRTDRFLQFALATAQQAVAEADIADVLRDESPDRTGVIVGSGIGGLATLEEQHIRMLERGPDRVSPFFIPMFIADMAAGLISMRYGVRGPNYCTVSACASSAHAVGLAFRSIRTGEADVMIAGGTEATITPLCVAGFSSMKALSTRNEAPEVASRPFDAGRDGFVLGEGSGMVIMESLEHARARGATILAELKGFGQSADAYHMTAPAPGGAGAQVAMRHALTDAGLEPGDIDYINAHGTSTPANDATETVAIKQVFGERAYEIVVGSTKSMTGHSLGAAGAVETVISTLVCREGLIPPTINFGEADPECDLDYGHRGVTERPVRAALSNSFGFGGHNVALAIGRWDED